jgi:hypothetical protein
VFVSALASADTSARLTLCHVALAPSQAQCLTSCCCCGQRPVATPNWPAPHRPPSLHEQVTPVLGGFSKDDYKTERLWAVAPDGARVPISLVYRRASFKRDGAAPLLLKG